VYNWDGIKHEIMLVYKTGTLSVSPQLYYSSCVWVNMQYDLLLA